VKALTVKAPWSWAITHSTKRIENRVWERSFRGALAIHAGKGWDEDGQDSALVRLLWQASGHDLRALTPNNSRITLGAVVAVADLVDICSEGVPGYDLDVPCGCGPWAARGQYHWKLANVRPLAVPVPCRGALGLWMLPDDVDAAVVAQMGERANA
jgi:hypothetical protein